MRRFGIKPKQALLVVLFLLLASYATYQARAILIGPQIFITSPKDGATLDNPVVTIEGQSRNVAWIRLNGRQIFTDEKGYWREKLIVSPGVSIMTVEASDRFGRDTRESVRIILK